MPWKVKRLSQNIYYWILRDQWKSGTFENIFYFIMYNLKFSLQMHSLLNWGLRPKKLGLHIYFLEDKNSLNIKSTILQINNQKQMSFISSFSPRILGQASAFMQMSASGLKRALEILSQSPAQPQTHTRQVILEIWLQVFILWSTRCWISVTVLSSRLWDCFSWL